MTATQEFDDFFAVAYDDSDIPEAVERDRWGRPLITPPDGGDKVPYTRMSTLSGYIENKSGLHIWDVRQVVVGMGVREDLAAMAAALPSLTKDKRKDAATNARLSEIAEEARTAAGAHAEANWGTAVHGFTEMGMEGAPVPERMKDDVRSYWEMLKEVGLAVLATEIFVVNDELGCAGTFDDLMWHPFYGLIVGDKKTGKKNMHSTLVQLSGYANAVVYIPEAGERVPLEVFAQRCADAMGLDIEVGPMNREKALYIHLPAGEGRTELYDLDIALGYEAAKHAAWIRDYQRRKDLVVRSEPGLEVWREEQRANAYALMHDASTVEEFRGIWKQHEHVWTDEMSTYGMNLLRRKAA